MAAPAGRATPSWLPSTAWRQREDSGLLVTPDVVVISEGRFRQGGSTLRPSELSLVVEVESHTTRRRDRTLERSLYEEWGVPYLLIDPDTRTISYYGQPPWPLDLEDIFD